MKRIIAAVAVLSLVLSGCSAASSQTPDSPEPKSAAEDGYFFEVESATPEEKEEAKKLLSSMTAEMRNSSALPASAAESNTADTEFDTDTQNVSSDNSDTDTDALLEQEQKASDEEDDYDGLAAQASYDLVDLSWFDDCVIIGDSNMDLLSLYNECTGGVGNAEFISGTSLGYANAQWDIDDEYAVHPFYKGEKVRLEDAVTLTHANKVIIGMGMNDLDNFGPQGSMPGVESFMEKFMVKSEGAEIYMLGVFPMIESKESDIVNNDMIREFNSLLSSYASSHGITFIDPFNDLSNKKGKLPDRLCIDPFDMGVHLTNEGCEILMNYIRYRIK